jgi:hypothetical protein
LDGGDHCGAAGVTYIDEALAILPQKMDTLPARVMLDVIQRQEDPLKRRRQWPTGPGRGLWQFEQDGGVAGVLEHPASADLAKLVCEARGIPAERAIVWNALEHDDVLAAAFARLLLWTDPKPLPRIGDEAGAWSLYIRTWRPGKPWPAKWPANYRAAVESVTAPNIGGSA